MDTSYFLEYFTVGEGWSEYCSMSEADALEACCKPLFNARIVKVVGSNRIILAQG